MAQGEPVLHRSSYYPNKEGNSSLTMALRLPPPPPPPPPPHPPNHHSSSNGGSSSSGGSYNNNYNNNNNSGNSGNNNVSNNSGSNSGSNTNNSNSNTNYPYKSITMQSGLMFLLVGAVFVRMLGFFRQHWNTPGKKRLGYLDVAENGSGLSSYRDNPLRNRKHPSSPKHPAISSTPPQSINVETMRHLQSSGIRMMAHGVHCEPRKVWISIDDQSIIWQSEFKKGIPDMNGKRSLVAVRGSVHRIDWQSIEYIDVGKRTDALKQATAVADHLCFSLLTPDGSLDLQSNSQLERDTLVSCLGIKLDEVHGGDWRQLFTTTDGGETQSIPGSSPSDVITSSSFSTINQPYRDLTLDV
jgi:hypothetical protein